MERLTVGEIARLTGVTVRTLHHYDEIGLVVPGARSDAGYRWYGPAEIARLQEVLFFRELGFGLSAIREIVDDPGYRRREALERQRRLLEARVERLLAVIDAVDAAVAAERGGRAMTAEEMLEVFGGFDPAEYEDEARDRWGETDAYRESARRTAGYTSADGERMREEAAAVDRAFLDLMEAGVPPGAPAAAEAVARHREHIDRWFYPCSPEIHAGLGRMYLADPRFRETIDRAGEGLAAYLSAAIAAAYPEIG